MAKVTKIEDKRIERDHQAQDRKPELQPDRFIQQPGGDMKPAPLGPSILDM